jgi:O-antigen/teichoic acid export membrane protein
MSDTRFLGQWLRIVSWQGAGSLMAVGTVALAAIAVPPAVFARYSLMLSIAQVGYAVAFAWINHALFRYAREERVRHGTISGAVRPALYAHAALIALCALAAVATGPAVAALAGLPVSALPWCVAGIAALAAFETATYAAQAGGRFDGYGPGHALAKAGPFVAVLACTAVAPDAEKLFAGALAGWLAGLAWTARVSSWAGPARPGTARRMLAYGWRLPFASAAGMVVAWFGVWALQMREGAEVAGIYAWTVALVAIAAAALIPLSALLAPGMVDLRLAGDPARLRTAVARAVAVALFVAMLGVPALLALRFVAAVALPSAYAEAQPLLVLLCAALPAQLLSYLLSPLLMADETLVGALTRANVATALFLAGGIWICLPVAGALGAAVVSGIAVWALATYGLVLAARLGGDDRVALRRWSWLGAFFGIVVPIIALAPPVVALAVASCAGVLVFVARHRGWFRALAELVVFLPRHRAVERVLGWCAA